MHKTIPLGVGGFETLRKQNYYYVDKSMMISEFLTRKNPATLITRPRRFGKTINMSMMAEFFDITKNSLKLFEGTEILNTQYASEMNKYPTIFISFAKAKNTKSNMVKEIKLQLRKEYDRYSNIFTQQMSLFETTEYQYIVNGLLNMDESHLDNVTNALSFLMGMLEKYYGKKVMVFVDEYDTPFIEAHVGGYYEEIRAGLSLILHSALKTSTSLQYAMMTGIQRVAKENIFSDLNNLVVCTVKDPEYSKYFGFTEEETIEVLNYYNLSLNAKVKEMYDGYKFANVEIYNPWSILNYASRNELEPYWLNTSSNLMIKKAILSSDDSFKRGYESLIQKGKIETIVRMDTSFFEVNATENLWGLLVNAGYLTILDTLSSQDSLYTITIPNQEVQIEFRKLTADYLNLSETDLVSMFHYLKYNKMEEFVSIYKKILLTLPSFYDLKDENSYHMMILGMCAWLSNEYDISSNNEVGNGRCDIILKSKNNRLSYVLEFKYTKDSSMNLYDLANVALVQIENRKYDVHINGKVMYIGLAHYKKNVEIAWKECITN